MNTILVIAGTFLSVAFLVEVYLFIVKLHEMKKEEIIASLLLGLHGLNNREVEDVFKTHGISFDNLTVKIPRSE